MISKIIAFRTNFITAASKFGSIEKPLGRWKNECVNKTNLKIDLANEDHCGVCTGYLENYVKHIDTNQFNNFDKHKIEPIENKIV